jgi:hypothetical protein
MKITIMMAVSRSHQFLRLISSYHLIFRWSPISPYHLHFLANITLSPKSQMSPYHHPLGGGGGGHPYILANQIIISTTWKSLWGFCHSVSGRNDRSFSEAVREIYRIWVRSLRPVALSLNFWPVFWVRKLFRTFFGVLKSVTPSQPPNPQVGGVLCSQSDTPIILY